MSSVIVILLMLLQSVGLLKIRKIQRMESLLSMLITMGLLTFLWPGRAVCICTSIMMATIPVKN